MRRSGPGPSHRCRRLLDLNLQHDAEIVMVKGAVLTDTDVELRVQAELREDSAASRLVRRGALKGLSVEFAAKRESMVHGVRVVELAKLAGAGLVDQGPTTRRRSRCAARAAP